MKIKGVIFDLDGTLLDTLDDLGESVNKALSEYGYPVNPIDDYRFYIGNGGKNLVRRAMHEKDFKPEMDPVLKRFKEIYDEEYHNKTSIYDGIEDLLIWLEDNKIQYAVLSNKFHGFTEKIIELYFPDRKFSSVIGQKEGVPIKPDPTQVYEIIDKFKCDKDEVILIGDTKVDIETAKNAGIFSIGVTWGFRDKDELIESGADIIVDTPEEIREIIDS